MQGRQAIAIALLGAALAVAGCGLGPGDDLGRVGITVTRDFGAEQVVAPVSDDVTESDTVMRVLERNAEITTRYGGGFVQSIDGLEGDYGGGSSLDWFFYVNGVESTVGAADVAAPGRRGGLVGLPRLVGGDLDSGGRRVLAAAVRGWIRGARSTRPSSNAGAAAKNRARRWKRGCGTRARRSTSRREDDRHSPIRVLVGPWARIESDSAASQLESGPEVSGVYARFEASGDGEDLVGLDQSGEEARRFGPAAGLVAATRHGGAPPTWIVTGVNMRGVTAAADLLDESSLRDHYAVATEGGEEAPLPLGS